jgi:hypothetical protein
MKNGTVRTRWAIECVASAPECRREMGFSGRQLARVEFDRDRPAAAMLEKLRSVAIR